MQIASGSPKGASRRQGKRDCQSGASRQAAKYAGGGRARVLDGVGVEAEIDAVIALAKDGAVADAPDKKFVY